MRYGRYFLLICSAILTFFNLAYSAGEKGDISLGLRMGLNLYESDVPNPALTPCIYGNLGYNINDFFALGIEGGYSALEDKDRSNFKTFIFPFEMQATLNFFPLKRINPYAILGGGGVYWDATDGVKTLYNEETDEYQEKVDSFIKAGGGIEFAVNEKRNLFFNVGATYHYSLTEALDQIWSGDEKDGVIDFYAGLNYTFRAGSFGDKDDDGVPDELDLAPEQKEDKDGYMDHDGKPDGVPSLSSVWENDEKINETKDTVPPVVIHMPKKTVEEGQSIKIKAEIYENKKLKAATVIYRPKNFGDWKTIKLKNMGGILYQGEIPGKFVKGQVIEYCILAVDEEVTGIGYSGLPKRPINVRVIRRPNLWRIFNGTVAFLGWGAASYLILKKQK